MSGPGKIVLWIGFFLITMNVVMNWQTIKSALFSGEGSSGTGGGSGGKAGFCSHCATLPLPLRLSCEAACLAGTGGLVTPASKITKKAA